MKLFKNIYRPTITYLCTWCSSLEMDKRTLLDRLIATTGNYSRLKLRNPKQRGRTENTALTTTRRLGIFSSV